MTLSPGDGFNLDRSTRPPRKREPPRFQRCVECNERLPEDKMISDNAAKWHCLECLAKR